MKIAPASFLSFLTACLCAIQPIFGQNTCSWDTASPLSLPLNLDQNFLRETQSQSSGTLLGADCLSSYQAEESGPPAFIYRLLGQIDLVSGEHWVLIFSELNPERANDFARMSCWIAQIDAGQVTQIYELASYHAFSGQTHTVSSVISADGSMSRHEVQQGYSEGRQETFKDEKRETTFEAWISEQ
ncbi:hypothetical protein [Pontibacter sp. G13]|uniref:hypothetical protein n=1 Tax=Pontibacter sp. G13 TaxID=3074898 RepID=UPI00288BC434|nr:hypothetical protein [Pontibacter sp. G13]WNJ17613.1 hypothetical protein RJD25_22410 [Pontibacter sp. G13]